MIPVKFRPEVYSLLKSYVYVYTDPRNQQPFYIGMGRHNRAFSHIDDKGESRKVARIQEIRKEGKHPVIDILRYGLTQKEAALIEASAIDLIGLQHLTNECRGTGSRGFGRVATEELRNLLSPQPVRLYHKAILIIINRLYRSDMTSLELYEATRGVWKVGPRHDNAEIALAVYQGVIREVYRIIRWLPAGTLKYETRESRDFKKFGRWEFEGGVAPDLQQIYLGKSTRHLLSNNAQNPIRYGWVASRKHKKRKSKKDS
jgi:hypothetical protein